MKITLNLLPEEIKASEKAKFRRTLALRVSISLLVLMVAISVGLFALVLIDSFRISDESRKAELLKNQLETLKEQESLAAVLKNRLDSINSLIQTPSPQDQSFNLITKLLPSEVLLRNVLIDKNNRANVTVEAYSTASLENLFNNLTDPKIHDGKISKTAVENFNKNQANVYRVDLNIETR